MLLRRERHVSASLTMVLANLPTVPRHDDFFNFIARRLEVLEAVAYWLNARGFGQRGRAFLCTRHGKSSLPAWVCTVLLPYCGVVMEWMSGDGTFPAP